MPRVVLISGKQGAGKSAVAKALAAKLLRSRTSKFAGPLYALGNLLYDHLHMAYDLQLDKEAPAFKRLLQVVGTEWGRQAVDDQIWVKCAQNLVARPGHPETVFVFDDCRFENELLAFPTAVKVRLVCDRDERRARADRWREDENHPSETGLDHLDRGAFDLVAYTGENGWPPDVIADMIVELLERNHG